MREKTFPLQSTVILILTLTLAGCGGGNSGGPGGGTTYTPGQASVYKVDGVSFTMRYAPGGSFVSDDNTVTYDQNLPGRITVSTPFWIAETEVTYQLWKAVYDWATTGSGATGAGEYTFQNPGAMGDGTGDTDQHPVTFVSWRDAVVWCNALTEYYNAQNGTNLKCVYHTYSGVIARDSTKGTACDYVVAGATAGGFRLPLNAEWELAARYQDGTVWTPGNHVSGDATGYCEPPDDGASTVFRNYARYSGNSGGSTYPVASRLPNFLGLVDMSGNVWEWCFDRYPSAFGTEARIWRGGSWMTGTFYLRLGYVSCDKPGNANGYVGFRVVRTQ